MKHKPYICDCCGDQTITARGVEVTNMENPILCNDCSLNLHFSGSLVFSDTIMLKLNKNENHIEGDTINATAWTYEKPDYWESRRRVDLLNQMSGFPSDNGVHASY